MNEQDRIRELELEVAKLEGQVLALQAIIAGMNQPPSAPFIPYPVPVPVTPVYPYPWSPPVWYNTCGTSLHNGHMTCGNRDAYLSG